MYQKNPETAYKGVFYLLHTVEFNAVLLCLTIFYPTLMYVSLGFVFHIITDIMHHSYMGMPVKRWLFLVHYYG